MTADKGERRQGGGKQGRERKRWGIGSDSEVKKHRNGGEEDGGDGGGGEEAKRADRVTQRG